MLLLLLFIAIAIACKRSDSGKCSSPVIDSCTLFDDFNTTLFGFGNYNDFRTYLKLRSNQTVITSCPLGGARVFVSNSTRELGSVINCTAIGSPVVNVTNSSSICYPGVSNITRYLRFSPADECLCNHLTVWIL